jgi:hypothetical protein
VPAADLYSTQVVRDIPETTPAKVASPAKPPKPELYDRSKRSQSMPANSLPKPTKQVNVWGTSVIHEDEGESAPDQDIYSTSVVNNDEEDASNAKEDDAYSTSVVHNDVSPVLRRKASLKKRASFNVLSDHNFSQPSTVTLPPAEMQKIMESTMKAVRESETKLLKEIEKMKNEIMGRILAT